MADVIAAKAKTKIKPKMYLCGTPEVHCCGSIMKFSSGMKAGKIHPTPEEAFKCHARYLVNVEGFKQVGPREFETPNGGPIRVLTKKSRFGAMLRGGKEQRYMSRQWTGGLISST